MSSFECACLAHRFYICFRLLLHYHVNASKPGFNTIGMSMWHTSIRANGKMAVNSVMFHDQGMKGPRAIMIIATIMNQQKIMLYLNFRSTMGASMKKFVRVTSFAVAPHCLKKSAHTPRESGCGFTYLHIDSNKMAEECLAYVEANPAEEDQEHQTPLEALEQGRQEFPLSGTIT